eukprot:g8434.t1
MENEILNADHNLEDELANGEAEQHEEFENDSEIGLQEDEEGSENEAPFGLHEAADWIGLSNHPTPTGTRIVRALQRVSGSGKTSLTLLIIGKAAVGKSTTINSLFATDVVELPSFSELTPDRPHPLVIRKRTANVSFTVVDAQGLIEADQVSETGLKRIAFHTKNQPVDVVMFIDRFDIPRPDELDYQIMIGLTRIFGRSIWSRMIIGLTRADMRDLIPGQSYERMVDKRVEGIRALMRRAGDKEARLPYVLIENSEVCQRNSNGEKVLQNDVVWIPTMFEKIVEVALCFNQAYKYNPKTVNRKQNLITKYCIIPLVLFAQIIVKIFIIDPVIREDGLKGDKYGPFDQDQQDRARAKLKVKQEAEKRRETKRETAKQEQQQQRNKVDTSLEDELSEDSEDDFSDNDG